MKTDISPKGTWFGVIRSKDSLPAIMLQTATAAKEQTAFRLAGGCSGMSEEQRNQVCPYFVEGLPGYGGVAISGATSASDGIPMVTNVPAALAQKYGAIALGTCPRTYDMYLPDEGSVGVSEYGDTLDRGQHAVAVIQKDASQVLDWDGDLEIYMDALLGWREEADWKVGVLFFNGGGVTKDEFLLAIGKGIPTIVVAGSGRFSDVLKTQWDGGDLSIFDEKTQELTITGEQLEAAKESGLVQFADFTDAGTLTSTAKNIGLLN